MAITNILLLIMMFLLLMSCDTGFHSKGVIIEKVTQLPIDSVKINIKGLGLTYSDSLGHYEIDTVINKNAGALELLLEKEGYVTRHITFDKTGIKRDSAVIALERTANSTGSYCINSKYVAWMFYFNKYVLSLINILTLLFLIIKKKIKWRLAWIIGVLLCSFTLFISYTDCSIVKFYVLNGPIYLTHFWVHPYSVKIVMPIATIAFWVFYNKHIASKK